MGTVIFDTSMSLDGFMTASGRSDQEPMGVGGLKLVEWAASPHERNRKYLESATGNLGAVICGRVTYDTSLPWWGADGPSGSARRPVFVVTHAAPDTSPPGGVYSFVVDGVHAALRQAQAAAGEHDVTVMGGADIGRQFLAARLVDEISIHLVPVLLGSGTPMFQRLDIGHVNLEPVDVTDFPEATHLRYRIVTS